MKNIIFYIPMILIFSCKHVNSESKEGSIHMSSDSLNLVNDSVNLDKNEISDEDCVFDQETQTDEFLKGIKELENYVWDSESKTAEIVLNDHWGLTIKRGGCNHFEMSASFLYDRVLDFEKDKKQIFDNIIWITSLLKDFDAEIIKESINNDKIVITKDDKFNYHINFMDVKLYELYFMNFNNDEVTTFDIGYYYN